MKYQDITRKHLLRLLAFIVLMGGIALFGGRLGNDFTGDLTTTAFAQQDALLERRISQVEQRFYYIESRINRLESESRYPGVMPGTSTRNDTELSLLRTEVETVRTEIDSLRLRIGELECGLIKVDERTLAPVVRQARKQSAPDTNEPCRVNPNAPVRLSARP